MATNPHKSHKSSLFSRGLDCLEAIHAKKFKVHFQSHLCAPDCASIKVWSNPQDPNIIPTHLLCAGFSNTGIEMQTNAGVLLLFAAHITPVLAQKPSRNIVALWCSSWALPGYIHAQVLELTSGKQQNTRGAFTTSVFSSKELNVGRALSCLTGPCLWLWNLG